MNDDPNQDDQQDFDETKDDSKHEAAKSPSALGEEDPFSGDATSSESPDIDAELEKVGLQGDDDGVKPLGVSDDLDDEEM